MALESVRSLVAAQKEIEAMQAYTLMLKDRANGGEGAIEPLIDALSFGRPR